MKRQKKNEAFAGGGSRRVDSGGRRDFKVFIDGCRQNQTQLPEERLITSAGKLALCSTCAQARRLYLHHLLT